MNFKYILGCIFSLPLLPIMYFQGKKIRAQIPSLPEATGTEGKSIFNNTTNPSINLLTIGESTMAGVGVQSHEEGFTGSLAKELSAIYQHTVKWKVYAKSGYTAASIVNKIIPKITETDIDLIVIGLGANDAFTLNTPSKWKHYVVKIIAELKSKFPKAFLVFCNMPPIKEFPAFTPLIKFTIGNLVEILGEELHKITKDDPQVFYYSKKITLADWLDHLEVEAKASDFFSDGIHPSKLTYQTWAIDLARTIQRNEKTAISFPFKET
ncbi:SGNH/GDSL hydrolase family protein [Fulvivirgaceae bacterium LMO-SS25]